MHHYVVIYKATKAHRNYGPADGRIQKKTHDEFKEMEQVIILIMMPYESFATGNEKTSNIKVHQN